MLLDTKGKLKPAFDNFPSASLPLRASFAGCINLPSAFPGTWELEQRLTLICGTAPSASWHRAGASLKSLTMLCGISPGIKGVKACKDQGLHFGFSRLRGWRLRIHYL